MVGRYGMWVQGIAGSSGGGTTLPPCNRQTPAAVDEQFCFVKGLLDARRHEQVRRRAFVPHCFWWVQDRRSMTGGGVEGLNGNHGVVNWCAI
jgi:hypothetical protein